MIDRIKNGTHPTEIFRELFSSNPQLSNYELASIFHAAFGRISGDAVQAIWYWKSGRRGDRIGGYNDDELNTILIGELQNAGYLSETDLADIGGPWNSHSVFDLLDLNQNTVYQAALDLFTYVKLYAPDFPTRDQMTCEKAMRKLFEYFDAIETFELNTTAKRWLRNSHEELRKSNALFTNANYSEARKAIGNAQVYLKNAKSRKPIKANFTIEGEGLGEK